MKSNAMFVRLANNNVEAKAEVMSIDVELLRKQRNGCLHQLDNHHQMERNPKWKEQLNGIVNLLDTMLDVLDNYTGG